MDRVLLLTKLSRNKELKLCLEKGEERLNEELDILEIIKDIRTLKTENGSINNENNVINIFSDILESD